MTLFFLHCSLFISRVAAQELQTEYWFDQDPGLGRGITVETTIAADGRLEFEAATSQLSVGHHLMGVRSYHVTAEGAVSYGPTLIQDVYVRRQGAEGIFSRLEYYWDEDPGYGQGTPIPFTPGGDVQLNDYYVSTEGLSAGRHQLFVRAFGGSGWSPVVSQQVLVRAGSAEVSMIEYFWDEDPGCGKATPVVFDAGNEQALDSLLLSTEGLSPGEHVLGVRPYGGAGWGPTVTQQVVVRTGLSEITMMEYFWDEDPGWGKATPLPVVAGSEVSLEDVEFSTDHLPHGKHQLGLRARGEAGWGPTVYLETYVKLHTRDAIVTMGEYFWNEDPGYGNGTPLTLEPGEEVDLESFDIPTTAVHGDALLFIRYRSAIGWSPTTCYRVMVDAEGNYTLNAEAETSIDTRNYQSLDDVVGDFSDRGVGDNITFTLPTTDTAYPLDATTDSVLSLLTAIRTSMDRVGTPREDKTIGFQAVENSGNRLAFTTTGEGLPTVLHLLARTWLEHVALTVNDIDYDFTPWATTPRYEERCSSHAGQPLSISLPMEGMAISFTPQPHEGTTLTGYVEESTPFLPAMTITNSSTQTDSLAYRVVLSDLAGHELDSFIYYIYVHPLLAGQTISGQQPAHGSSLDPGRVVLRWNPVGGADGYRLTIVDRDQPEAVPEVHETRQTSYEATVESGHHYEWQLTAVGPCDELSAPAMTFEGRLLPDLAVSSIALPEAAEAGNTIAIRATIVNQGEGATVEPTWTDRLYYVIDSQDFAVAIEGDSVKHNGLLGVSESYEVEFALQVPYVDKGNLHVFVVTDAGEVVMESNDENNRQLSLTPAVLHPFYMNSDDWTALGRFYNTFGGPQWNGEPWNIASQIITEDNWSGVTFDTEGRVTAIQLQDRGLSGSLSVAFQDSLPQLRTLNLSHNALHGDPSVFLSSDFAPRLQSLNLSYNQIGELAAALPEYIRQVELDRQTVGTSISLSTIAYNLGQLETILPRPMVYNVARREFDFDGYFVLFNDRADGMQSWRMDVDGGSLQQATTTTVLYDEENGHEVRLQVNNGKAVNEMLLAVDYESGDANLDWFCDVTDLQHLINYAVSDTHGRTFFNFKAGNLQPDGSLDVLDVVRMINILLAQDQPDSTLSRRLMIRGEGSGEHAEAVIGLANGQLVLNSSRPVAALDLRLTHPDGVQIEWLLDDSRWQVSQRQYEGHTHVLVYSLSGEQMSAGETVLARIASGKAVVSRVTMADINAARVRSAIGGTATAIGSNIAEDGPSDVYSTDGVKHDGVPRRNGVYIIDGKKIIQK